MKIYFAFSKTYALIFCFLMLIFTCFIALASQSIPKTSLENERDRSEYISNCGIKDAELLSVKSITIPLKSNEKFQTYVSKVKNGGFDILLYSGKTAVLYTYLTPSGTVHLLTLENKLICADFCDRFGNISYLRENNSNGKTKT